ncbi:MAG: histidine phosphatase family protein [Cyanothece sp. SIO2G6]|nr:histidine phosphatase family protein [Cyanothece sp. SIO2G6]
MMLTLLFIRHGESVGNCEQRMQGHGDYPLSDQGQQQVQRLAQRLANNFEAPTQIYSSPLPRARQTTKAILRYQSSSVCCDYTMAIAEGRAGVFAGLTWSEACQQYPLLCQELETTADWVPIPAAESPGHIRHRAQTWIQAMLRQHGNGDRVWLVTHEWILYQLVSAVLGCNRTWQFSVAHTALFEFWLDRDRWLRQDENTLYNSSLWQIRRFNDTQHLE